jgi:hypothetical protein
MAPDAFGLAQRKDIGAGAVLSFAASQLWITPPCSLSMMVTAREPRRTDADASRRRWLKEVADARLPTREAAMAAFAKRWRRE